MALSSLESIAEKLAEANRQTLEEILMKSGSNAMVKSEYGVTIVSDDNVASKLIFKPLTRAKYDNDQIIKSLNPGISELKPDIPNPVRDLVPKPLYDEQVTTNNDLKKQIDQLNNTINNLNGEINNLKGQLETEINNRLSIEQSNDVLSNQSQTLSSTVDDFSNQIQNSLQKSVEESILRGSLQAQNAGFRAQIESLIKQIDSLNSIIEGLQSQLGAVQQQQAIQQSSSNLAATTGGFVINEVGVISFEQKASNPDADQIIGRFRSHGGARFDNGSAISITNNDTAPIKVKLSVAAWPAGRNFLSFPGDEVTIAPNENKKIGFGLNEGAVGDLNSRKKGGIFGGATGSETYGGGKFVVSVTRTSNGSTQEKTFGMAIRKMHKKSF